FRRLPGNHEIRARTTLYGLIWEAYRNASIEVKAKGASWITVDFWDLDAKADRPFTEPEMIAMLRNLLADRFKLQAEKEQKPGTIYVLTVDPGGLKIQKNEDATALPQDRVGAEGSGMENQNLVLFATAIPMAHFISTWPFILLQAPVVDATGLTDRYDI